MSLSQFAERGTGAVNVREVRIPPIDLPGTLVVPRGSDALVIFAHGSGSSRFSPRNIAVAEALNRRGIATLLFDLLTPSEEADRANVFNIPLLAWRLRQAADWSGNGADGKRSSDWLVRREHRRCGRPGRGSSARRSRWRDRLTRRAAGPRGRRARSNSHAHALDRRRR